MTVASLKELTARAERFEAQPLAVAPAEGWAAALQNWTPPQTLSAGDERVDFTVEGLIQAGKVGALVAAGGTGKTSLLLTLGVCIATGRPFLGLAVKQGSFVLLSADDPQRDLDVALGRVARAMRLSPLEERQVCERVRVFSLLSRPGVRTFAQTLGANAAPTELPAALIEALAGVPDLRLLAFDTFRQFSGGNSTDEQVAKLAIAGAGEVAERLGCGVVFCHHTGKQAFRDGFVDLYVGTGSAAIADNARFILLLQAAAWSDIEARMTRTGRERGQALVLTPTRGSLLVPAPPPLFLHRDGFLFGRIEGALKSAAQQVDDQDVDVLRAVRAGAISKSAVAAQVRGRKASILARVDDLLRRGLLRDGSANGSGKQPLLTVTGSGSKLLEADL